MEKELLLNLHDKLDNIRSEFSEDLKNLNAVVAKQEVSILRNTMSLEEHMKRTDLSEKRLELFEQKALPALNAVKFIYTLGKILVPIGSIIAFYFEYIKK